MRFKVLFVVDGLGTGGAERSLSEMLTHFRDARIEPVIVCSYRRSEGVERSVLERGYDVRFLPSGGLDLGSSLLDGFLTRARALRAIIADERPDLIHTMIFQSDMIGRVAAAGTGVPVLSSLVNTPYAPVRLRNSPHLSTWKSKIIQLLDACSGRFLTAHFHAVTHAVKAAAMRDLRISASRITVVERGRTRERLSVPSEEQRRRLRQKFGFSEGDEVLLNVGRQEYQKGQRYLLKAMKQLVRERPRLTLLIAGRRGHASDELDRLRQHPALEDRVHFLGHRDDVPDLLAAADVFVFPSLYEGIGGAVLEAMAVGLPIVTADIAPMREVNEEGRNALLVQPESARDLADALRRLLDDADYAQSLGRRSRAIFEERFTLERNAGKMVALYHEVVAKYTR